MKGDVLYSNHFLIKCILIAFGAFSAVAVPLFNTVLPEVKTTLFDGKTEDVDFLIRIATTLPSMMVALLSPLISFFTNKYGKHNILIFGTVLLCTSAIGLLYSPNFYTLIILRALIGIGQLITMVIPLFLIADYFAPAERRQIYSFSTVSTSLGGAFITYLGGLLANYNWQYAFFPYLTFIILLPLVIFFLPPLPEEEVDHHHHHEGEPRLNYPYLSTIYTVYIINSICFGIFVIGIPSIINNDYGGGAKLVARVMSFGPIGTCITSLLYIKIKNMSYENIIKIGAITSMIGLLAIGSSNSLTVLTIGIFIFGMSNGLFFSNANPWISSISTYHARSLLLSINTSAIFIGHFLAPLILTIIPKNLNCYEMYYLAAVGQMVIILITLLLFPRLRK